MRLLAQPGGHRGVPLVVDRALQRRPVLLHLRGLLGALVVVRDEALPQRLARRQPVVPRQMVEPEQQVLRRGLRIVPPVGERLGVLVDGAAAAARAVEADALLVGPVVVGRRPVEPPRVVVLRHHRVVIAADQVMEAERHRVVHERLARAEHQRRDRLHGLRLAAPGLPDPLVGDGLGASATGSTPAGRRRTSWPRRSGGRSSCGRCRCWRRRRCRCARGPAACRRRPSRPSSPGPSTNVSASKNSFHIGAR